MDTPQQSHTQDKFVISVNKKEILQRLKYAMTVLVLSITIVVITNFWFQAPMEVLAQTPGIAERLQPNQVAVTILLNQRELVEGLRPDDRVDVIMSMVTLDVDEDFQSPVPNNIQFVQFNDDGTINISEPVAGHLDTATVIDTQGQSRTITIIDSINGPQLQRPVSQITTRNAVVLEIENRPTIDDTIIDATQTRVSESTVNTQMVRVTLAVSPQDATVLTWAMQVGVEMNLVIRAAGGSVYPDTMPVQTSYILNTYNITIPTRYSYALSEGN